MKIKFIDFFKSLLLSYAAILFCGSSVTGFIFLSATFINYKAGLLGLMGALASLFFAYRMKIPQDYIKTGIFGCNGILIGLAWGHYFDSNLTIAVLLIASAFFSNHFIMYLIEKLGKKYELPTLSFSFVVFAWIGLLVFKLSKFSQGGVFVLNGVKHLETQFANILPFYFQIICRTISFTFFQDSIIVGIMAFLGILFYSRISFLFAFLTGVCVYFFMRHLQFFGAQIPYLGFNSIFMALAFGGFFLRLGLTSVVFTFIAVFLCLFVSWAVQADLSYINLPILAFPFNLTAILLLAFLRLHAGFRKKYDFQFVPLDKIKSPEENLNLFYVKKVKIDGFCFPFYGAWKVSQGVAGKYTHKGAGKYALDFWVIDGACSTFTSYGLKPQDYYSFGLPVAAPCGGKIIKVVNDVPDNPVGRPNASFPWGNYVIIETNGVYVEISHFKYGTILAKEGDKVVRGQILGKCGNSGRSYQPHIHIQIQDKAVLGSQTLPFKFDKFVKINHEGEKIEIDKLPREGDIVKNFAEDFDTRLSEELFPDNVKFSYINKLNKETNNWHILKAQPQTNKILKCGISHATAELKDGLAVFKRNTSFGTDSLKKFLFGFYKIPVFLKTNAIWVIEENNFNWAGFWAPFGRRRNIVKNKYLGKSKICVSGAQVAADKFSSSFLIDRDIWLKEVYLAENKGLVKMIIFKNGEIAEDWELISFTEKE